MNEQLTDTSPYPFGKYKGVPMQDVPVEYLHWIYMNTTGQHTESVKKYIVEQLDALKIENPDLIWKK